MGNPAGVRRDFEGLERRRREAAELLRQGVHQAEVARRVGAHRQSVSRWAEQLRVGGLRSLKQAGRAGRKPRLRLEDLRRIDRGLKRGPKMLGYKSGLWTPARVAHLINIECGVQYHPRHAWRILRQLRPAARAPSVSKDASGPEAQKSLRSEIMFPGFRAALEQYPPGEAIWQRWIRGGVSDLVARSYAWICSAQPGDTDVMRTAIFCTVPESAAQKNARSLALFYGDTPRRGPSRNISPNRGIALPGELSELATEIETLNLSPFMAELISATVAPNTLDQLPALLREYGYLSKRLRDLFKALSSNTMGLKTRCVVLFSLYLEHILGRTNFGELQHILNVANFAKKWAPSREGRRAIEARVKRFRKDHPRDYANLRQVITDFPGDFLLHLQAAMLQAISLRPLVTNLP